MPAEQNLKHIKDFLKKQFNLPAEQVDSMIPGFIETLRSHLRNLEQALAAGTVEDIGKAGHTIKGALLNLGLEECADIAYKIESNGKAGDQRIDYSALVDALKKNINAYL